MVVCLDLIVCDGIFMSSSAELIHLKVMGVGDFVLILGCGNARVQGISND